ncbi:MAG: TetR/AcrR family transcriptional regulator [Roseibium sp.]|uniref:TetR/AcrR family transcriptional regulator n=1 Tax=Roseibium sp. TaxID=1936156 RepID=UPI002604B6DC|nr:TetR/AcrR family transcriptional regulator [Roseibium sp.]MCV0426789.1 TetR/AcrR family transcriptional regulator [Roseibium sp.]
MKTGTRFSKEDWLALGLKQLSREGSAGLTVEALCNLAGRTRGSFYHHFNDHDGFIDLLLQAWKQRNTIDVADEILSQAPDKRAQHLSDLANHLDQDLERAVRQFAQSNKTAQRIVREVDGIRTEFVVGLYVDAGLAEDEARDIAQLEYAAFVGSQIVWPDMTAEQRVRLDRRFAGMVRQAFGLNDRTDKS